MFVKLPDQHIVSDGLRRLIQLSHRTRYEPSRLFNWRLAVALAAIGEFEQLEWQPVAFEAVMDSLAPSRFEYLDDRLLVYRREENGYDVIEATIRLLSAYRKYGETHV